MAITYRQTKGSALTIEELDANFEYFTGSHSITGSLIVSSSIQASSISGSYFILPVLDSIPSDTPPNGTIKLFSSASANYIYAYLSGSWVSASLV